MKTAKELFAEDDYYWYDYDPIIDNFGNVVEKIDIGGYQGDTLVFYDNHGCYGFLSFGWGSCSGCDALQACSTLDDVQELMDDLYNSIKWFDTIEEAREYFSKHDWAGDWSYYQDNVAVIAFKDNVLKYLSISEADYEIL